MAPPSAAPPDPAAARRWSDLRKRFLSAAILAPSAIACIWLGAEPFTAMVAVAIAILTWEWVHLCGLKTRAVPGAAVPFVVLGAGSMAVLDMPGQALLLLGLGFLATFALAKLLRRRRGPGRPVLPSFRLALGVLYIGLAGISLIVLRHDNTAGQANVLFLFLIVWASDIGAYMAGRLVGGPKLAPAISPNKTWSGAAGGVIAVMLVGMLASTLLVPGSLLAAALVALVLGIATQIGDLLESWLKRQFQVKDTSSLIPGHGGLLDRLDGLLAAAPVAALIALWRGIGVTLWW